MIKSYSKRQYYRSYFCSFIDKNFTNLYKIKQSSISTLNVYQNIFLQHRRLILFNKLHNAIELRLYEQVNTNTQICEFIVRPLLSEISKVILIIRTCTLIVNIMQSFEGFITKSIFNICSIHFKFYKRDIHYTIPMNLSTS